MSTPYYNPLPEEVAQAQSFPCPAEPEPIDHLRRVMRVIASGHLSASGARDLAVMVLSLEEKQ